MKSGPVEQFIPITSMGSFSRMVSTAEMSVPSSMRPVVSSVTCACMGKSFPVLSNASCIPCITALTSRISCDVSINKRSTAPVIKPSACSQKISFSSSKLTLDSSGSFMEGSFPEGPMEPATKRGFSGVENSSASWRASLAADWLMWVT